jgi:hypothetical protein
MVLQPCLTALSVPMMAITAEFRINSYRKGFGSRESFQSLMAERSLYMLKAAEKRREQLQELLTTSCDG